MQRLVDSYACEWKQAIDDPGTLKRFRHFINSAETDTNIQFVDERGPDPADQADRAQARRRGRVMIAAETVRSMATASRWVYVCRVNEIVPNTGVCAKVGNDQVAVFRVCADDESASIRSMR